MASAHASQPILDNAMKTSPPLSREMIIQLFTTALMMVMSLCLLIFNAFLDTLSLSMPIDFFAYLVPLFVINFAGTWVQLLHVYVPDPYLDEVFHIPQAQKYCQGRYAEWDDKITTPPGLYILSDITNKILRWTKLLSCDVGSLRYENALALVLLAILAMRTRHKIEALLCEARHHFPGKLESISQYSKHTALNIALFPILFFFGGLYYTDVASTTVVVGAFLNSLVRMGRSTSSLLSDIFTVLLGIIALFMRQTNIFWIVVFLGGLEGIHAVKTLDPERVSEPNFTSFRQLSKFYAWRYSVGDIHDLPSNLAWIDDYIFTVVSIIIAAVCNPVRVLKQIWPYITVLFSFTYFVAWNGGVVLGDKSNHVATLHLAQMLYIWPFFAFFSVPLILPSFIPLFSMLQRYGLSKAPKTRDRILAKVGTKIESVKANNTRSTIASTLVEKTNTNVDTWISVNSPSYLLFKTIDFLKHRYFWATYMISTLVASVIIVRFNTIIHPFTLADNRHYMFYIFRYTIRRGTWIRYALVLPYTISRWMLWSTLQGCDEWFADLQPLPSSLRLFTDKGRLSSGCYTSREEVSFRSHPLRLNHKSPQLSTFSSESQSQNLNEDHQYGSCFSPVDMVYCASPGNNHDNANFIFERESILIGFISKINKITKDIATLEDTKTFPPEDNETLVRELKATLRQHKYDLAVEKARLEDDSGKLSKNLPTKEPLSYSTETVSTSTVVVFLLATTLSLITAPLVEPRYFIIPWVIYRLLVPAWRIPDDLKNYLPEKLFVAFRYNDMRLVLETIWFIAINVVTISVFLFKPYQWRAEDGSLLDEGRLQRFMW